MTTLRVNLAERGYDIHITSGDRRGLGPFARERVSGSLAFLVSDEHVGEHADRAADALAAVGFHPVMAILPSGEAQKALAVASYLYDGLAEVQADRKTLVVAVGGGVIGDLAGNAGAEVAGDAHDFGVGAVGDDAAAGGEGGGAGVEDDAGVAVAERNGLIELGVDGLEGGGEAVGAHLLENHADFIGLLARLVDPAGLAEIEQHALGAGGDEGGAGADPELIGSGGGTGDFGERSGAVAQRLKDLEHGKVKGSGLFGALSGPTTYREQAAVW